MSVRKGARRWVVRFEREFTDEEARQEGSRGERYDRRVEAVEEHKAVQAAVDLMVSDGFTVDHADDAPPTSWRVAGWWPEP